MKEPVSIEFIAPKEITIQIDGGLPKDNMTDNQRRLCTKLLNEGGVPVQLDVDMSKDDPFEGWTVAQASVFIERHLPDMSVSVSYSIASQKQKNILMFIRRNTGKRYGQTDEKTISDFIDKYWKQAQAIYYNKGALLRKRFY